MSGNNRVPNHPSRFLCEHTPSKSRVYAVVEQCIGPDILSAVLTCTDRTVADRAAVVLNAAFIEGFTDSVLAAAADVTSALPAAPASSFRAALDNASKMTWPASEVAPAEHPEPKASPYTDSSLRSPSDARLKDLRGKVVRLMTLKEYHVYDEKRLLTVAHAKGFEPMLDDEDDPDDLIGAVSFLADQRDLLPGADIVTETGIMELIQSPDDELADWSSTPIIADFGAGSDAQERVPKGPYKETMWGAVPDFAVIFDPSKCEVCAEDDDDHWHLTPRTADMLHTALIMLSDEAYDDVESHGDAPVDPGNDWMVFDRLPKLAWSQPASWRREFARSANDLADDLEVGKWPAPTNAMEEMVLHLAIKDAPSCLEMAEDNPDSDHFQLPEHPDDYDWGFCSEVLFQDHDILMLFNAKLSGIADPSNLINVLEGVGDLRPESWTEPFDNVEARSPERGFRR